MSKDEALKLALEALEAAEIDGNCEYGATEIIRKALAEPDQEPVATCERCADEIVASNAGLCANCLPAIFPVQEPVFKWHSVFQEMPVENSHLLFCFGVHVVEGSYTKNGWASLSYGSAQPDFWAYFPPPPNHKRNQELYAMPQPRPWVGLTDEEIYPIKRRVLDSPQRTFHAFAGAIEAKLKEKNT